jgi:chromate reductase
MTAAYNQISCRLPNTVGFKSEIAAADGLLFVTPEHNRSIPTVLNNAIDCGARPYGRNSWNMKLSAITGTSPGAIGASISQQHLRQVLGNLGVLVMGGEAYVSFKPGLIDGDDAIADDSTRKFLQGFIDQFGTLVARFADPATRWRERRLQGTARSETAHNRIHWSHRRPARDEDTLEAVLAIGFFMHAFETVRLEAGSAASWSVDEAKVLDEEDTSLKNCLLVQTRQFARKRVGRRVSKVDRQGSCADRGSIVKLYPVRLARCTSLPSSLQLNNRIDERGMSPWFGDALRLL